MLSIEFRVSSVSLQFEKLQCIGALVAFGLGSQLDKLSKAQLIERMIADQMEKDSVQCNEICLATDCVKSEEDYKVFTAKELDIDIV